jgi:hypothetical protein
VPRAPPYWQLRTCSAGPAGTRASRGSVAGCKAWQSYSKLTSRIYTGKDCRPADEGVRMTGKRLSHRPTTMRDARAPQYTTDVRTEALP